jgi:hypothetical protein
VRKRTPTPVPPLGDAAIARIERGVFAALDSKLREAARPLVATRPRSARRLGFGLGLAGAAAAAALSLVSSAAREGRRGEALPARAAQFSTTTSGSRIALAGATLDVAPQSAVSFGGGRDGAVVVVLDRGTVTCEVAARSKRAPFVVEAGATRVTVIGTKFSVRRIGEHAVVSVEHGLVEVADTNMTELVHAGEHYEPGLPGAAVVGDTLASEALPAAAPSPLAVRATPVEAAAAPAAASGTPATPLAAAAPARAHRRRLALAEVAAPARPDAPPAETPAPAPAVEAVGSAPATTDAPAAQTSAESPIVGQRRSVQVLFELAAQLELRDPEAALRIYGELASAESRSDGGWAASALFAAARLEAERGRTQHARELSETYLQRFPRGPNADDARTLLAPAR